MSLSVKGKVVEVLEEQTGKNANGIWRRRDFILKTKGEFGKKICMTQWGDEIDNSTVQFGEIVTAHIDLQSREHNGRWYTDVKVWRIESEEGRAPEDYTGDIQPGNSSLPFFKKERDENSGDSSKDREFDDDGVLPF